jgi:hypothetical protein
MTKITEVMFETQMSPNGADIGIPKQALDAHRLREGTDNPPWCGSGRSK